MSEITKQEGGSHHRVSLECSALTEPAPLLWSEAASCCAVHARVESTAGYSGSRVEWGGRGDWGEGRKRRDELMEEGPF